MIQAVFRVDASVDIGSGHFMRCLSLARAMVSAGVHCRFVCRDLPGHMAEHIRARNIDVVMLPLLVPYKRPKSSEDYAGWLQVQQEQDAAEFIVHLPAKCDLVVVDHYALDETWEAKVKLYCKQLVVIDDLCRPHTGDFLIDSTFGRDQSAYSESKVKSVLVGEQYALLKPEYYAFHEASIGKSAPSRHRLLISMGGYDMRNLTGTVLNLLKANPPDWLEAVDIVLTASAPHYEAVRTIVQQSDSTWILHDFVRDFGQLMSASTLAIGAAGTTTWERAACGLPSIMVPVAENQAATAAAMRRAKASIVIEPDELEQKFEAALIDLRDNWANYANASLLIADGLGCGRVLQRVLPMLSKDQEPLWLDLAKEADVAQLSDWLQVSEAQRDDHKPWPNDLSEQQQWLQAAIRDPGCYLYILRKAGVAAGVIRLDRERERAYGVSVLISAEFSGLGLRLQALNLVSQLHSGITIRAAVS